MSTLHNKPNTHPQLQNANISLGTSVILSEAVHSI